MSLIVENHSRFKSIIFHALADPLRLEILEFLRDGEKCVCEIIPHLNTLQPVVSRHLKILKDAGLVKDRKEGNKRFYSTVDNKIYNVIDGITPELVETLSKEAFKQKVCR
ncbi:MAG: metalloregulator ArsR/SmtB family transcription factor [Candidatus Bathyarchaeota archaeon]|nr:metalloregulator ArsR/SmtB family transcription factor [Candidatus Bathyarchaeota archaeon]